MYRTARSIQHGSKSFLSVVPRLCYYMGFDTTTKDEIFFLQGRIKMSKSPIEFYDEELSRMIREIQRMQVEDASSPELDRLFVSCGAYIQQMNHEAKRMQRDEKKQWLEIIKFRTNTYRHLQNQTHTVNY